MFDICPFHYLSLSGQIVIFDSISIPRKLVAP